jgi:drug/metabolite transporter (DMT)-like permease
VKKDYWLIGIAAACGAAVWIVLSKISHHREAWDSELYFIYGIPIICVVAAVLAYIEPKQPWRWAVTPFAAQGIWMLLTQGFGSMFPLGLVVLAIFSIPALLTAALGAFLARKTTNRPST